MQKPVESGEKLAARKGSFLLTLPQPKHWFGIRRAQLSTKGIILSIEGPF
jgi:hypothetical protein